MRALHLPSSVIRRLRASDLPQLDSHFMRLEPSARRARFGYAASRRTLAIHAERCFERDATLYGFVEHGILRGVSELHVENRNLAAGDLDGELAFSIETRWRHCGVGTRLMQRSRHVARKRQVTRLSIVCAADNLAMLGLARRFATDLCFQDGDVRAHLQSGSESTLLRLRDCVNGELLDVTSTVAHGIAQLVRSPQSLGSSWHRSPPAGPSQIFHR